MPEVMIDTSSREYLTLQTKRSPMEVLSTTTINNWSNGQNLSHGSQENYPNGRSLLSAYTKQINSLTEPSQVGSFILSSNIVETVPYETQPDITESTNYNRTKKPREVNNINNVIVKEKITEHVTDIVQTIEKENIPAIAVSDVTVLWIALSSTVIIMIGQILFCFLTCGHYILQLKED
ncbi:hypothetical protein LOAG_00788 [Loa loa]|uniref:Uncharacterized protein n=1 Tax=Loa loa TaxID=7209 RepID=A0A1S0UAM1_LOALO|nr:hypothetical protein LOAG_00788 [Loa loa]EFO27693.1 hypothetical protein LOAG_00788 [Loa loa]